LAQEALATVSKEKQFLLYHPACNADLSKQQ